MKEFYLLQKHIASCHYILSKKIENCLKQLEQQPEGYLVANFKEHGTYYEHYIFKDKKLSRKGITKNSKLVNELLLKEYYSKLYDEYTKASKVLNYIQKHINFSIETYVFENLEDWKKPLLQELLYKNKTSITEWENESYNINTYKPDGRIIRTQNGTMVRSKSEREIANRLTNANIPFRYEAELVTNGVSIYPDFTILNPINGRVYYWEHAGMIDNEDYNNNSYKRFSQYAAIGVYLNENLIYTTESKNHPLETEIIDSLIEQYFM